MKLSNKASAKTHRIMLFGPPKSGKTQLAGECAEEFDLLWFDLESGIDTLKKFPIEWQERIEVVSLPDTRSYPIAIETCLKVIKGGPVNICEAHGKVDCPACKKVNDPFVLVHLNSLPASTVVVFDSITQLTNSAVAHITKGKPDDYRMEFEDWGNLGKLMDIFMSHVQNAPCNIICISHETAVEMVDGKPKIVPTAGSSNFSRNTAKYFDEVIYTEVKNGKHKVGSSTGYANAILTGSRSGYVTDKMEKVSLIPILKGEVIIPDPTSQSMNSSGTPAATAVKQLSSLEALKAKVQKGT
jgi:AAA domain-containing protein